MKVPWTLQKLLIRVIKNSNKKLLEVQEPFLEKVPGRRRHRKFKGFHKENQCKDNG
jgi:hypothetical protein